MATISYTLDQVGLNLVILSLSQEYPDCMWGVGKHHCDTLYRIWYHLSTVPSPNLGLYLELCLLLYSFEYPKERICGILYYCYIKINDLVTLGKYASTDN